MQTLTDNRWTRSRLVSKSTGRIQCLNIQPVSLAITHCGVSAHPRILLLTHRGNTLQLACIQMIQTMSRIILAAETN